MKHLKLTTVLMALALTAMVVPEAEAGWLGKDKKKERTEKTEEMEKPARYDNFPPMVFVGGILSQDAHSGWKIGGTPLFLRQDCVISMEDSEEGYLEEGRRATVMGARVGGAISAYSVYVSLPEYQSLGAGSSMELKEAGPNPNVGKIVKPLE